MSDPGIDPRISKASIPAGLRLGTARRLTQPVQRVTSLCSPRYESGGSPSPAMTVVSRVESRASCRLSATEQANPKRPFQTRRKSVRDSPSDGDKTLGKHRGLARSTILGNASRRESRESPQKKGIARPRQSRRVAMNQGWGALSVETDSTLAGLPGAKR